MENNNEADFLSLCNELKTKGVRSVWSPMFIKDNFIHFRSTLGGMDDITGFFANDTVNNGSDHKAEAVMITSTVHVSISDCQTTKETLESYIDEKKIVQLKEALINITECQLQNGNIPELLIFCTLPSSLIPALCKQIKVELMEETAVAALLNTLLVMEPPVSHAMGAAVMQHIVYPKVMHANSSRLLSSTIIKFSKKYCKAVIDELLMPCIANKQPGPDQKELFTKVIKSGVPDELILSSLRKTFETVEPNEHAFAILQSLCEKKAFNDVNLYNLFTWKLKEWSTSYSDNLKFMNLIISIISAYGNKIAEEQLSVFEEIAASNKTCLKKAAENLLNKFKKCK